MKNGIVILDEADNVATAMKSIDAGVVVIENSSSPVTTLEPIPFGHKIAILPIRKGERIVKYGEPIGMAREDIAIGACVHVHNVESERGRGDKGQAQ